MKKSVLRVSALAASALATSIATHVQAAVFPSNGIGGGIWEDPASWLPGVGYPNTFTADSATISAGDTITYDDFDADGDGGVTTPATPYTAAMGVVPGGLSVANGNSITLTGSAVASTPAILLQANLPHEIRIGEGAGGVSGIGTLTLDGDGTSVAGSYSSIFSSGSAVGVAVGSDINNAGLGNGTVNIKEGLFVMGVFGGAGLIPGGPAALGVGIEGSTGVINVGNGVGPADSAVLDLETNGNNLGVGVTNQLGSSAGNGTVIVNSDGLLQNSTGSIFVGTEAGGVGLLRINGGRLGNGAVATGEIRIGGDGGTGTLDIRAGSTVNVASDVNVGRNAGGLGTLIMTGGTASVRDLQIGRDSAAANSGTVSGGTLTSRSTWVGRNGTGTLGITGAGTIMNTTGGDGLRIGVDGGASVGTVNIEAGAVFNLQGWTEIGASGGNTGTLNVKGAGTVYNHLEAANDMQVGYNGGTGNVNVTDGAKLTTNWWMNIARGGTSTGNVLVDGAGSEVKVGVGVTSETRLIVGEDGVGNMTVSNGGIVTHNTTPQARTHVGQNSGSMGTLNVQTGGQFNTMEFFVGDNGGATGVVNIASGGSVTMQDWMEVGSRGGTGTINVDGVGSRLENIGGGDGRNGGAGGDNQIGYNGGTGTVNVSNGGTYSTKWWLNIGRGGGSTGTVSVDGAGSKLQVGVTSGGLNSPRPNIGEDATGTLNVSNGGGVEIVGDWTRVGANNGSNGTFNINSGGTFTTNNWLLLAAETGSTGTMNIADAGTAVNVNAGGDSGRFITGRLGTAVVNQTGGDVRVGNWFAVGIDNGGNGTYNFDGGTISVTANIDIGNNGVGVMNITNGNPAGTTITGTSVDGHVNYFNVGGDSTGNGTLNINLTDPNGKIVSRELYAGWGSNGVGTGSGTINITQGTLQTDGWVEIGRGQQNDGNVGTVNVDGPNSRWERGTLVTTFVQDSTGARDMNIGQGENPNFGKGYLNVRNGGTVRQNWWINLARQPGSEGHIVIDGYDPGSGRHSSVNMVDAHLVGLGGDGNSQLNVGEGGLGTLDITNGGIFNHNMDNGGGEVWIARNGGSTGTMTVDGIAADNVPSQFNSKGREFLVGGNGTGTLNIRNGGQVFFDSHNEAGASVGGGFRVGASGTAVGTVNLDGAASKLTVVQHVNIGENGPGTVNMTGGTFTVQNQWFAIAVGGGSTGTVNVTGGLLDTSTIGLEVGSDGNGTLNVSGTGVVRAGNIAVGVRDGSVGVINVDTNGLVHSNDHITLGGDQSGGTGTLNMNGGVVETNYIASQDDATLRFAGGTLRANQTNANFIRGFDNTVGPPAHSAIIFDGDGGTIDSNGFDIRIKAPNVITNPADAVIDGLAGTVLNKDGTGTLTVEVAAGDGNLAVHVLAGTLDFETDQILDTIVIDAGATLTVSALSSPPAPAGDDGIAAAGSSASGGAGGAAEAAELAGNGGIQTVPEPGVLSLLTAGLFGLMARRRKTDRR